MPACRLSLWIMLFLWAFSGCLQRFTATIPLSAHSDRMRLLILIYNCFSDPLHSSALNPAVSADHILFTAPSCLPIKVNPLSPSLTVLSYFSPYLRSSTSTSPFPHHPLLPLPLPPLLYHYLTQHSLYLPVLWSPLSSLCLSPYLAPSSPLTSPSSTSASPSSPPYLSFLSPTFLSSPLPSPHTCSRSSSSPTSPISHPPHTIASAVPAPTHLSFLLSSATH